MMLEKTLESALDCKVLFPPSCGLSFTLFVVVQLLSRVQLLASPLDCEEIQPVHPKGYQSWVFIGKTDVEAETPILWPPDVKN